LLADENTSLRLVSACRQLVKEFPIVHIARWQGGTWLGLDDASLLIACAESGLVLVAFDRATLPWHAGRCSAAVPTTVGWCCSVEQFAPPATVSSPGS
jgi:hypothetical protein